MPIVVPVVDAMLEVVRSTIWQHVEAYKQKHVPESEYLFSDSSSHP